MVSRHRGDRHAGKAASGNQLRFELEAVGTSATAGLGKLVVGVHVSTIYDVDMMLLDLGYRCQMGWPDAYRELRQIFCPPTIQGDDYQGCLRKLGAELKNEFLQLNTLITIYKINETREISHHG